MARTWLRTLLIAGGVTGFGILMYFAGWNAGNHATVASSQPPVMATPAQNPAPFQEVIPPGNGITTPGTDEDQAVSDTLVGTGFGFTSEGAGRSWSQK